MEHGGFTEKEELYYCSRYICFPKTDVLRHVMNVFEESGKNELAIDEIYSGLRGRLCVAHVNRGNLLKLLDGNEVVKRNAVRLKLQTLSYEESKRKDRDPGPRDVCLGAAGIKKIVDDMGLDFLCGYLSTDGVCFENFCRAMKYPGRSYLPVESVSQPYSRETLLKFIGHKGERAFRELLGDEESFKEEYGKFSEEFRERKKAGRFIAEFRTRAAGMDRANYDVAVKYLVSGEDAAIYGPMGVRKARDLIVLADTDVQRLYSSEESALALLDLLQTGLSDLLTDQFRDVLSMAGGNGVPHKLWKKYAEIIECRALGLTLEAAGRNFDLTRERVRQLEVRYFKVFAEYSGGNPVFRGVLRALSENGNYVTPDEIRRFVKFKPEVFVYLMKKAGPGDVTYSADADLFCFMDGLDWIAELTSLAAALPDVVDESRMNGEIASAAESLRARGYRIPPEICGRILKAGYRKPGSVYSRSAMPLGERYNMILKMHFPDGMRVYDKKEMDRFRRCYRAVFDDGKISEGDRAMGSRIMDGAVLCGRGTYKPKQEKYVSDELVRDIYEYMMNSDREIFVTNALFRVFEDRLRAEGVDNKYYMQGILGECLRDKPLYFKRDYISKNRDTTSVYDSVVEYVRTARRSVTKAEIMAEFPGISEVIVAMACRNTDAVVNGFATYTHRDTILEKKRSVEALGGVLEEVAADGNIHCCRDLVEVLRERAPFVLDDFEIENAYKLFSVMQLLYADKYELRRPFFAKKGVRIERQTERIREFLSDFDEIPVSELMEYINENDFKYYSIMSLVDEQAEFFYKDGETLVRAEKTGLDEGMIGAIERFLDAETEEDDFVVTSRITDWSSLPAANTEWNGWLLYSAVRAWSGKYRAMTTSNKLKYAVPVIVRAEVPAATTEDLADYGERKHGMNGFEKLLWMEEKGLL